MRFFVESIYKNIKYSYIVLIGLMCVVLGFYTIGFPQIAINFLFLFLFTIVFLRKQYDLILFLFLALFPTNGFVNTEYNIFGILNSKYIVSLFALFSVYMKNKEIKIYYKIEESLKYGFYLVLFISIYLCLVNFKLNQLGIREVSLFQQINIFIKRAIDCIILFFIIKFANLSYYKLYFQKAFFSSLVIISLSMIFVDFLFEIGVYMNDEGNFNMNKENQRLGGVWGLAAGGDVNSLGGYLVMGLSCVVFSSKKQPWLLIILIVLGIMLTGSRTGFINLIIVIVFFIFFSQKNIRVKIRNVFLVSIIGFILFRIGIFDFVIERMRLFVTGEDEGLDINGVGRLSGWVLYTKYILSDVRYILFGVSENIFDAITTGFFRNRVVHNFYIQVWYYFGIFALLLFLYLLLMLCGNVLKSRNKIQMFLILPAFITLFTVSDVGVIYYIPIVLSLFTDSEFNSNQKKYVYKK